MQVLVIDVKFKDEWVCIGLDNDLVLAANIVLMKFNDTIRRCRQRTVSYVS